MRALLCAALLLPTPALADAYFDIGKPEQCGDYGQASFDGETWFPGGEGGAMALTEPQQVRGLDAMLFDGIITEEGFYEPGGRVLALQGELSMADGPTGLQVLVIATERGIQILQRCP